MMGMFEKMNKSKAREILGVNRDDDAETIKKAYRKLAMKFHPDRNQGDKDTEEKFKEVKAAYDYLSASNDEPEHYNHFSAQYQMVQRASVVVTLSELVNGVTKTLDGPDGPITIEISDTDYPGKIVKQFELVRGQTTLVVQLFLDVVQDEKWQVKWPSVDMFSGDVRYRQDTGIVVSEIAVDAITMITGGMVNVTDIRGKTLEVRIPSGFPAFGKLKLANRGLRAAPKGERLNDAYIIVRPIIEPLNKMTIAKLEALKMNIDNEIGSRNVNTAV